MTTSATFPCAACGNVAATVTLFDPGQPDPKQTPEPPGAPPGVGSMLSSAFQDEESYESNWATTLDVNLTAHARLIRLCLPHLQESGAGRIVKNGIGTWTLPGVWAGRLPVPCRSTRAR